MKILPLLIFCASAGFIRADQDRSTPPVAQTSTYAVDKTNTAQELLNEAIYSSSGEKLGRVADVVMEESTGKPEFVLIETGGKLKPVPAQTVVKTEITTSSPTVFAGNSGIARIHHGGRIRGWSYRLPDPAFETRARSESALSLNLAPSQFRQAPSLARNELGRLQSPGYRQQLQAFYGRETSASALAANSTQPPENLTPTGRTTSQRSSKPVQESTGINSARQMVGKPLFTAQGEEIGMVNDILLDLDGTKESYAIVTVSNFIEPIKRRYAIATSELKTSEHPKRVILEANWRSFDVAPSWDNRSRVGTEASPEAKIFKY